ncbi:YdeI/OmpD-associated family protein [Paenibacillus sp. HB172176]|uniref:YdeI/OmpD-associated family protein n=1 Tax=Paenibacillus sp. HB172176 TaxID=2493690 RepID=UPI001438FD46|nr:YdeI/OmpD-associated family protein [Paenibacillus sp. HB172176]
MSSGKTELPEISFQNQTDMMSWLSLHGDSSPGFWLSIAKKDSGLESITYDEAMECALCYGWVDSQKKKGNTAFWLQRFTPRGKRSIWSKINKEKAERLLQDGRIMPAGLAVIEAAKANGQWEKSYEGQKTMEMPEDFANALEQHAQAKAFYESLNRTNQYAMLFRIHQAKKQETRAARIEKFIGMLEREEKIYT